MCWPQRSSTGFFCGTAVQSDSYPAPRFAHFFWQDRRNQIANQRSVCNLERTSTGTDETCRLRRGEGLREAPRAQALRRAIGLAERMQSEASLGVCEDEPPEAQLRCCRKKGSSGETGKALSQAQKGPRFCAGPGSVLSRRHNRRGLTHRNWPLPPSCTA